MADSDTTRAFKLACQLRDTTEERRKLEHRLKILAERGEMSERDFEQLRKRIESGDNQDTDVNTVCVSDDPPIAVVVGRRVGHKQANPSNPPVRMDPTLAVQNKKHEWSQR